MPPLPKSIYRRILRLYAPYAPTIGLALSCLVGSTLFQLLKPWPVKWLLDVVLPQAASGTVHWFGYTPNTAVALLAAALLSFGFALATGACTVGQNYFLSQAGLRALLGLRTQLYSYLQHLPLHFHDGKRSGDSIYRVAYDAQAIQTFLNRGLAALVGSVLALGGTFVVMLRMDVKLALISLSVTPLLWFITWVYARRIRMQTLRLQREESDVLSKVSEGLTSIRIVHAYGREDYEVQEFAREAEQSLQANLRLTMSQVTSSFFAGAVLALGAAVILYLGAQEVLAGRIRPGDLWVFLSYLAMLQPPMEQLSYTSWALEGAAAGAQRVFEILDQGDEVPEKPRALKLTRVRGRIDFEGVHFSYETNKPVLNGVTFTVEPGQRVALVGGSGCGKTTVLSLVPRFYDPQSGVVRMDGHDVRDVTKKSVREQLAIVLQETILLTGTVRENIAYGRIGATPAEIEAAARAAQAHAFITQLPHGYDTSVGERGIRLSGGQRQRIGIARAFLKQAPILLLDEPTSSLDLETEGDLIQALNLLMLRQTTLIVSQRLATIHDVDCIYVMENGKIAEHGRGPELLARGGVYTRLWNAGLSSEVR